jgi:hypothetical protein
MIPARDDHLPEGLRSSCMASSFDLDVMRTTGAASVEYCDARDDADPEYTFTGRSRLCPPVVPSTGTRGRHTAGGVHPDSVIVRPEARPPKRRASAPTR